MKEVVWVTTALLALGSFGVGHALGQLQRQRTSLSLEGITGSPAAIVTPQKGPSAVDASKGVPPGWTLGPPAVHLLAPRGDDAPPQRIVLRHEPGGLLNEHWRRFNGYALNGQQVEVRGHCASACTIVMITVSRDHLCFDRDGALLFHLVQHGRGHPHEGEPNMQASLDLYRRYPSDIRAWFDAMGGIESMPHGGLNFWRLGAEKLWAFGYRKCD